MTNRVKLAVVGGRRGGSFGGALRALRDRIELAAVCDLDEEVLALWRAQLPDLRTFTSYEEMLDRSDCDAVLVATPPMLHARQSIMALEAGRHVLSEVWAADTLDDCWQLIEAVESSGLVYMMAENYCYGRPMMMVLNMVQQGMFGELTYAEGAYIHDTRMLMVDREDELTWRGRYQQGFRGNPYPTHSLGPVAQWFSVNRPGGDRLLSTATWVSQPRAAPRYITERLGPDHPAADAQNWRMGDSATTVIQTEKGAVIVLRNDGLSPRPHNMVHYVLQGTQASYMSIRRFHEREDCLVWIDGKSSGSSPKGDAEWDVLWEHAGDYEHPYWAEWREVAEAAGHGGGDFFVLKEFADVVQAGGRPPIDVYDAVTWSSIVPLSAQSVARGSAPVEIPDFRG